MIDRALRDIYNEWEEWAASAPKEEEGWEIEFPKWSLLVIVAENAMVRGARDKETLSLLEKCWEISECCEEISDFARDHIDECLDVVTEMAKSEVRDVRYQAYSVLSNAGATGETILRRSLNDADSYARRRAYLALAEICSDDAFALAAGIIEDQDPYMRIAAVELLRCCSDPKLLEEAKRQLLADRNPLVRKAAEEKLS